jgi:hypothetical protein
MPGHDRKVGRRHALSLSITPPLPPGAPAAAQAGADNGMRTSSKPWASGSRTGSAFLNEFKVMSMGRNRYLALMMKALGEKLVLRIETLVLHPSSPELFTCAKWRVEAFADVLEKDLEGEQKSLEAFTTDQC